MNKIHDIAPDLDSFSRRLNGSINCALYDLEIQQNVFSRETTHILVIVNLNFVGRLVCQFTFLGESPKSFDSKNSIIYKCLIANKGAADMPENSQLSLQLTEITDCFSALNIIEKRCLNDEFVELVIQQEEIDEWHRILSAFLGEPTKPQGVEPSKKDLKITSTTGGIRLDQTLFEQEFKNGTIIAKFWPWQNNVHITLRMALLMK